MKAYDKCLDCLSDMIGISGCETPTPCALLIDSLGGISAEFIEAIADPTKHDGYLSVLDNAKKLALVDFKFDVLSQFGKYATFKKEVLKTERPSVYTPLTAFASTKSKFGVYVELPENQHQILEVYKVSFFPRNAGTVTITIVTPLTGDVLHTENIEVVPKFYEYEINKSFIVDFNGESIVVYVESLDVVFNQMSCGGINYFGQRSCGCGFNDGGFGFQNVEFDDVVELNANNYSMPTYSPMCVDASVNCSVEQIMCDSKFKQDFATALMDKVYLRLIEFQLLTPNINYLAEVNFVMIKDEIKPAKTKDYYAKLGRIVKQVVHSLSSDSVCFTCTPESSISFSILAR